MRLPTWRRLIFELALGLQRAHLLALQRRQGEAEHLADRGEVIAAELREEAEQLRGQHRLGVDQRGDRLHPGEPRRQRPLGHREHDADQLALAELADHARPGAHRGAESSGDLVGEGLRERYRDRDVGEEGHARVEASTGGRGCLPARPIYVRAAAFSRCREKHEA